MKLTSKLSIPEKMTSLKELRDFLENKLPSGSLKDWASGIMAGNDQLTLDGMVYALQIKLGEYSVSSSEMVVGEEAIKRFKAGEPDFSSWRDKKEVDLNFL
ncbi:MAG: hypothetical protein A2391_03255 [Candidatus Brennerbacteria bacterium RIFOXYB1_FULL_41_13]|nr:MAG: hypothetical protein A2391_03255 [Candidatus Brennerbacteria bacterium RIFOXYB1_FULL_41_13]